MKKEFKDYFHILEVHTLASDEAIKAAYRRLASKHHPDKKGDPEIFKEVQEAYHTLIDRKRRFKYLVEWKSEHLIYNKEFDNCVRVSDYDLAFNPVREVVNRYMTYIMNEEYEKAYELLSKKNKSRIFLRDFVTWQKLISQVHDLLKYDVSIDTFSEKQMIEKFVQSNYTSVVFKVKVIELNLLLNRIEEDYFNRELIYQEGRWCINLPKVNVKNTILKYKKIVKTTSKNKELIRFTSKSLDERYHTKRLSIDAFMQNLEYEYLRHERYGRKFSVVSLLVAGDYKESTSKLVEKYIERNTRVLDSFSAIDKGHYMILLPETDEEQVSQVLEKFQRNDAKLMKKYVESIESVSVNDDHSGIKPLLNTLINVV